ncbi:MAG: hypothetical protein ACYDC8_09805 [Gammaproteobacteria bacterium]
MKLNSKTIIAIVVVLSVAPLAFAGRGPDQIDFQQRIQKMDKLIEQAGSATTPSKREHLLEEHMQEMRACMNMMKGDSGMTMSSGKPAGPMDDNMMQMQQRMDMMQKMMDQMMKQQEQSMKMK